MHRFRNVLVLAVLVAVAACDQQPVGLPVTNPVPWRTIDQFPGSLYTESIWGSGPNDVYLVRRRPYSGVSLLHYDGARWTPIQAPKTLGSVGKIWGSGPNDIYLPLYEALYHFDGAQWTPQPVRAQWVTGTGPDDVYAGDTRSAWRFDGTSWTSIPLALRPYTSVTGVWATRQVQTPFIVAENTYPSLGGEVDSIAWWDGTTWTRTPAPGRIYAFWGSSLQNLVAVGREATGNNAAIWTFDGSSWTPAVLPGSPSFLDDIDGSGPDDLYATGGNDVLHYNGVSWASVPSPEPSVLRDVWVGDASTAYIVGDPDRVFRRSDGAWESVFTIRPTEVSALWAETPDHVVLGTSYGIAFTWQDGAWTSTRVARLRIDALAGRSGDDLYAGTGFGIFHYDGTGWSEDADTVAAEELAIAPTGEVFALDNYDGLHRRSAAGWQRIAGREVTEHALAVWAAGGHDAWVVGEAIWHYDGVAVRTLVSGGNNVFRDVWGRGPNDVYIATDKGILHYDGRGFTAVGPPGAFDTMAVGHVVASGGRNGVAYLDEGYWHLHSGGATVYDLETAVDGSILGLAGSTPGGDVSLIYFK